MSVNFDNLKDFDQLKIIFEDESLLIFNKPAGLVVNRASSVKVPTIQDWVENYFVQDQTWQREVQQNEVFATRSGMAHRLDKDTSGVLVFAKKAAVLSDLMKQFEEREVQKRYLTLVHGKLEPQQGIIKTGIERHPRDRERFGVSSTGRPSETWYQVERQYDQFNLDKFKADFPDLAKEFPDKKRLQQLYQGFSKVSVDLKTGRTHQIRVHMKFLHHPVVGDDRYLGRKRARLDTLWCGRQWLHAWQLSLRHPQAQQMQQWKAELPVDLQQAEALLQ